MKRKLSLADYLHNITWLDYVIFGVTALFCFLLFSHVDGATTACNSTAYLNGHILDFYSGCHELNGGYGANYLPSTFILYAIWNLPLKILSLLPKDWGVWNGAFILWNKLLPTIFYFFSAYIIFKLCCNRLNFTIKESKLAVILFISSPIGFYSQFLFGQYDIFTVFFMILGLYFFFDRTGSKRNTFYFIGSFAIAITFKYFALLIFLVLLLLKEKRIWFILRNTVFVLLPALSMGIFYYLFDKDSFTKSVLGFRALEFTQNSGISIAEFVDIHFAPILVILILALAYFTQYKNDNELTVYSMHFCSGICFVLFGLMNWHPQWLLFAVVFWNINFILHKQTSVFLWIDLLFGIIFNIFVALSYTNTADQGLFRNGIFAFKLFYKENGSLTMGELYPLQDRNLCFAILFAIMLIYFIFSHPKFSQKEVRSSEQRLTGLIRSRFLISVLSFVIPALICLPSLIAQYNNLWQYREDVGDHIPVSFDEYGEFSQTAVLKGESISKIEVWAGTYQEELVGTSITLTVKDSNNQVLASDTIENTTISDGLLLFDVGIVPITDGETYTFTFTADQGEDEHLALFISEYEGDADIPLRTYQRHYQNNFVESPLKDMGDVILEMKILGDK